MFFQCILLQFTLTQTDRMATWKHLANTSIQRSSQTVSVISGHAFIYGGELRPREPVDSAMHRIPIIKRNFTRRTEKPTITTLHPSTVPTPRVGAASTTLNGKIYIFSGRGGTAMSPIEESGSFWVFDPSSSTSGSGSGSGNGNWSQVHPADPTRNHPSGRSYHALTTNGHETIYLHAGCPETGRLSDLWTFNTHTREWTELPSAPGPARGGPSIAYVQDKIFRMNGFDGKTEQGGAIDVLDLAVGTGTWESIMYPADGVSGPVPRSVACLVPVTVQGRVTLVTMFGEHDPSSLGHQGAGKMLADVWAFDVEGKKWEEVKVRGDDGGEKPVARGWFAADALSESGVIVHGGLAESNERLGDIWRLDFA